jgi:hypothetical protein
VTIEMKEQAGAPSELRPLFELAEDSASELDKLLRTRRGHIARSEVFRFDTAALLSLLP